MSALPDENSPNTDGAGEDLQALIDQRAALDARIVAARNAARQKTVDKVKTLLAEAGLTVNDLIEMLAPELVRQKKVAALVQAAATPAAKPKTPVKAKYRDPASGQTWSGRGLKPKWLEAAMKDGKTLADFTV